MLLGLYDRHDEDLETKLWLLEEEIDLTSGHVGLWGSSCIQEKLHKAVLPKAVWVTAGL